MKFGKQLISKSVPEWKSYNIDYNDLKHRIRVTTEQSNSDAASVEELYNAIIEQIDMVNLFLQSKVGEVKRRIVYVENTVEQLETIQEGQQADSDSSKVDDELLTNLDKLSTDLQKLSRFIVLQKTGLRKLLKKYTKYAKDGGELNLKINKYMIKNQDSLIYVDLTGFYLELALVYDLIRAKQSPRRSLAKRRASYADPTEDLNINEVFDFENVKNGSHRMHFLVHYDNLTELKLFLLSNFSYVDESVRHERRNLQIQRQRSDMSFSKIIKTRASLEDFGNEPEDQKKKKDLLEINEELATPNINSIYLNNSDKLAENVTVIYLDDPKHLQSIKTDADPGVLMTGQGRTLLISAIGGLRKASNALLNDSSFVDDLLKSCIEDEPYDNFMNRHSKLIPHFDSLERISIEWLFSRHVKPLVKSRCSKARFTTTRSKTQTWITLSSNIKYSDSDLKTNSWTDDNESSSKVFPYAFLEVRYSNSSNSIQIPKELNSLTESHLVYQVENTLNPLTYQLFTSNSLSFEPSWAQYFGDSPADIHKTPPKAPRRLKSSLKSNYRNDSTVSSSGLSDNSDKKHGSVSAESTQFRYWNEFDNGSEGEDNAGFFVDVDSGDDQFFSNGSMEYFFKIANSVSSYLQGKLPFMFTEDHEVPLIHNSETPYHYGSTTAPSFHSIAESDIETLNEVEVNKKSHDMFRIFLALSSSMAALVLVALSLGVTTALLQFGDVSVNPFVIFILVITYFASMTLTVISIGLMMAVEEEKRKTWQVGFVWMSFFVVTLLTVSGTVGLFGL